MATAYQYKPVKFWLIAMAWSWTCWATSALLATDKEHEGLALLFNFIGLLAPSLSALIMIYGSGDAALKRDFKDRLLNLRRINPRYLIATFVLPFAAVGIAMLLSVLFGQPTEQFALASPVSQLLPLIILAMVLAPFFEETGWRGYGMDSLRANNSMLGASIWFGALWSLWHAPLIFIKGTYHYQLAHMDNPLYLANFFVSVVVVSILVSWLFYKHNRSIIAGVLLHSMLNASTVLPAATQPTKCIVTLVFLALAFVLIRSDKAMFAEGPQTFISET